MHDLSVLDRENKGSLLNVLPIKASQILEETLRASPHLVDIPESELREKLWDRSTFIPQHMSMLRLSFWREYDRAVGQNLAFQIDRVYAGICNGSVFYKMLRNPTVCAWMVCRPASYLELLEENLSYSLYELRKILELPILDKKGNSIKANIENKIKIFALLDARKHGAFVQKVQNQNMNINADAKDIRNALDNLTAEEIDKKLAMLEKKFDKPTLPQLLEAEEDISLEDEESISIG